MLRRVIAGVVGGVVALLPAAAVNAANTYGLLDAGDKQTAMLLATVPVLGGAVLGGLVAGAWAGRRSGTGAAGVAGAVAACLYAGSVVARIGLLHASGDTTAGLVPTVVSLLFVAALLIGIAMLVGRLVFREQAPPQRVPPPSTPARAPYPSGPSSSRFARDAEPGDPRWPGRAPPPSAPRYPAGMPSRSGAERDPRYRR